MDPRQHLFETPTGLWVSYQARRRPNATAIVAGDRRVSWTELDVAVNRVAGGLASHGISRGDKVALLASSAVEAVEVLFGVRRADATIVPLSGLLTPEILARLIEDSDAKVLFVSSAYEPLVPKLRRLLLRSRCSKFVAIGFGGEGLLDYASLGGPIAAPAGHEGDDCNIIYSSGTTGIPKGIAHSELSRRLFAYALGSRLEMDKTTVTLVTTPLYTNGTWMTFFPTIGMGGTLVLLPAFDATAVLHHVEQDRCTHAFLVPTQFGVLLERPDLEARNLSSVRCLISAGSKISTDMKRDILRRISRNLTELYGMTEGIGTVLGPDDMEAKIASVGRPIPGTEIRIIDDSGKELSAGEVGEIVGSSPAVARYYKKPEETQALAWVSPEGTPFIRTGDVGKLDEDGFLYILDRKKDMIVTGGINVYASDIEDVFAKHPDVSEVAAIAIPDSKWGETPLVLIVPRRHVVPDAEGIRAWGNERLGKHQRAARVELRTALPRNALGKVMKAELRKHYWPAETAIGAPASV